MSKIVNRNYAVVTTKINQNKNITNHSIDKNIGETSKKRQKKYNDRKKKILIVKIEFEKKRKIMQN